MKIATRSALQSTQGSENPLWLLFVGYPPFCPHCSTVLGPRFFAVELPYKDGLGNQFRLLAPVCSPICQERLITEHNALGNPGSIAWSPQKLRFALDDPAQFAGVIDISYENFVRLAVDTIIAAEIAAKSGQVV
jgi:hypothetical protein